MVFYREFDKREQADSQCLTLENSSPQHLQTSRAVISLSNRSPNVYQTLDFQWPIQTEWSVLYNFLESVSGLLDLKYASTGYDMALNIFYYPGSVGQAVLAAEESALCKSEYTEWSPRISSESEDPKRNSVSKVHPGVQLRILFQSSNSLSRIPCWTVCKAHGRSLVSRYSRSPRTVSLRNCEPLHSAL